MNQDNPLLLVGATLAVGGFFVLWCRDYRAASRGEPNPHALPGVARTSLPAIGVALLGAVVLLTVEVVGEYRLGIAGEQTTMSALFAVYTLAAAFGEELIFRGYLVVTGRGRAALVSSVVGFSAVFALAHPYLWRWEGGLVITTTPKGWFTTAMLCAGSLWFYWVRFQPANPTRSLLPCVVAHLGKNVGVIAVKASQGFLAGWW